MPAMWISHPGIDLLTSTTRYISFLPVKSNLGHFLFENSAVFRKKLDFLKFLWHILPQSTKVFKFDHSCFAGSLLKVISQKEDLE